MADDPEQAFLAVIAANSNDAEARAVYADWLEERGDPRGEYLRLEAILQAGPARLDALARQLDPAWLVAVTRRCDVVLLDSGPNPILVIRAIREITGYGLKDAKDLFDAHPPTVIRSNLAYEHAHELRARFYGTGARAVVTPHVAVPPPLDATPRVLWLRQIHPPYRHEAVELVRELAGLGLAEARALVEAIERGEARSIAVTATTARVDQLLTLLGRCFVAEA